MTRREILQGALVAGAAVSCARVDDGSGKGAAAGEGPGAARRDAFGGWTGRRFEATGFFRTEHDGQR
jgi:hypothetical protein